MNDNLETSKQQMRIFHTCQNKENTRNIICGRNHIDEKIFEKKSMDKSKSCIHFSIIILTSCIFMLIVQQFFGNNVILANHEYITRSEIDDIILNVLTEYLKAEDVSTEGLRYVDLLFQEKLEY